MADKPAFQSVQQVFTQHMRDPDNNPPPDGIEDRRMEIYRGLLYRNVEGFIAGSFPVLRKITPDEQWHAMIRDYFNRHRARTPLFPKMPQEFLQYLEQERDSSNDPPFLLELAHYEWVELALSLDTREINLDGIDPQGDLLEGIPVASPLVWLLSYDFPVHTIGPSNQPGQAPDRPTYLVVNRDSNDKVGFIELNEVSARLLDLIQTGENLAGRQLLENIARELNHPDPDVVIRGGLDIMQNLRHRDVLLGTRVS